MSVTAESGNKAGVYQRVEIHRWSNSFQKRAADYARKGMEQFLCTGQGHLLPPITQMRSGESVIIGHPTHVLGQSR